MSSEQWFLVFIIVAFFTGLFWAVSRDSFSRAEISLCPSTGTELESMAVLPKPVGRRPVAFFFYGANGSLLRSGNELRRLAELGFNAVGMEYDQGSQTNFSEQLSLLDTWVRRQPWADTNAFIWVGFSLGAQRSLTFALQHPKRQPRFIARVAGGWVSELDVINPNSEFRIPNSNTASPSSNSHLPSPASSLSCPVLIVSGENDRTFPLADNLKLAALLRSNQIPVQTIFLPEQGHAFGEDRPAVMRAVAEYLAEYFGNPPRALTNVPPKNVHYWIPTLLWLAFGIVVAYVRLHRWSRAAGPPSRALQIIAAILCVLATLQTGVHLITPQFNVSENTLSLARRWLVRAELKEHFEYLAAKPIWKNAKLSSLLTHLELAELQRTHFLKPADKTLFRDYVLSPEIDDLSLSELHWRREMWENFYPRIRKTKDPQAAVPIIIRFLRDRVSITTQPGAPTGLESIWVQQTADLAGFHRIYVAALRATGIPARLNAAYLAEYWTGSVWEPAPPPLVTTWEVEPQMRRTTPW